MQKPVLINQEIVNTAERIRKAIEDQTTGTIGIVIVSSRQSKRKVLMDLIKAEGAEVIEVTNLPSANNT